MPPPSPRTEWSPRLRYPGGCVCYVCQQSLRKTHFSFGAGHLLCALPVLISALKSFPLPEVHLCHPKSAGPAFEVSHLFPHQAPERPESLSGSFGLSGPVPPCCDKQCSDSQATQHTPWWCFLKLNGQESFSPAMCRPPPLAAAGVQLLSWAPLALLCFGWLLRGVLYGG